MLTMRSLDKIMLDNETQIDANNLELNIYCADDLISVEAQKTRYNPITNAIEVYIDLRPYLEMINRATFKHEAMEL